MMLMPIYTYFSFLKSFEYRAYSLVSTWCSYSGGQRTEKGHTSIRRQKDDMQDKRMQKNLERNSRTKYVEPMK